MKEYSKISIHNHFGGQHADCTIDKRVGFEVKHDHAKTYRQIADARKSGFDLLGHTNSNDLDAAAYLLARHRARLLGVELIPGIEANIVNWADPGKVVHVVFLFDPATNVFALQEELRSAFAASGRYALDIDKASEMLVGRRAIACAHGIKQRSRSVSENPEIATEFASLSRFMPVAFEDNRSYHKEQLKTELKDWLSEGWVEWLDAAADMSSADREPFDKVKSPTVIWAGNSFDDLYYSVLVGERRIMREEDVVTRVSYISRVEVEEAGGMLASSFDCSHGLNAIIGPSGSGKTLLLDLLKRKLTGEHLGESASSTSEYEGLYDLDKVHLYDADGSEIDVSSKYEVVEGANLYQKIIKAYGSEDGELLSYLGLEADGSRTAACVEDFERSANALLSSFRREQQISEGMTSKVSLAASAIRFIEANGDARADVISYVQDPVLASAVESKARAIEDVDADIESAKAAFEQLTEIGRRNEISKETMRGLRDVSRKFLAELEARRTALEIDSLKLGLRAKSQSLVFAAAQAFNSSVSKRFSQVNEKRQTLSTELQELAELTLELAAVRMRREVPVLDGERLKESVKLKSDSPSARLEIESVNLVLEDGERIRDAFPGSVGSRPRVNKSKFDPPYDLGSAGDVERLVRVFFDQGYVGALSVSLPLDRLLTYKIELRNNDGEFVAVEEQSAGMLSKVYVSQFLDRTISEAGSNTIVLYDQPEANMEKAFLLDVLAGKFDDLRRSHQLFVATHEPLLVVNADANEIILADNDKHVNKANRISYENRSFVGARGKGDLVREVARLIDGGPEAVKRRSDIYEGLR